MICRRSRVVLLAAVGLLTVVAPVFADKGNDSKVPETAKKANEKLCKLYGSGGYQGLASYGSGIVISPDGYILTVNSQMLNTPDLRVHLYNGDRVHAKIVVVEAELDVALLKIEEKVTDLPFFDVIESAKKPLVDTGTGVLAFSNQFRIATQDEPMSVQRGVVSAFTKLQGRRGIFDATYSGEVYFVDAITNNPGAGGGALTTRKGELLGLLGKELKNTLTDTWINYAVPIQAKREIQDNDQTRVLSIVELVEKKDQYKPVENKNKGAKGPGSFHGITLVPSVVERTPPYVEEVQLNSPAAKGGLKADDLIVYVDGEQVISVKEFFEIIDRLRPGTELKLEVRRGDKLTSVVVKLEQLPKKKPQ